MRMLVRRTLRLDMAIGNLLHRIVMMKRSCVRCVHMRRGGMIRSEFFLRDGRMRKRGFTAGHGRCRISLQRQREGQQPQQESFQNPIHSESLAWRVESDMAALPVIIVAGTSCRKSLARQRLRAPRRS